MQRTVLTVIACCGLAPATLAIDVPFISDFNDDTPGAPPAVGGPDQPTSLFIPTGCILEVRASANGIADQPIMLDAPGSQYISADYDIGFQSTGVLRIEVRASVSAMNSGYFLQVTTLGDGSFPVVTRLTFSGSGQLFAFPATPIGTYVPNEPFGVRMDIDLDAFRWAATIDHDLDGFDDEVTYADLEYVNPPDIVPNVRFINLTAGYLGASADLAYDDLDVHWLCDTDLGGDGLVGFDDLLVLLATWGPCAGCPADFDGDGDVGFQDLLTLLSTWGDCAAT